MAVAPVRTPDPMKRRLGLVVVLCIAFLAVMLCIRGGLVAFRAGSKVLSGAKVTAEQFLQKVEKKDYKAIVPLLAAETQKKASADDIADIVKLLEKKRGAVTGHTGPESWNIRTYNGTTRVQLRYQETFEKGETDVQLVMLSQSGEWKVESFNFSL
jgi:hypothetical protein